MDAIVLPSRSLFSSDGYNLDSVMSRGIIQEICCIVDPQFHELGGSLQDHCLRTSIMNTPERKSEIFEDFLASRTLLKVEPSWSYCRAVGLVIFLWSI